MPTFTFKAVLIDFSFGDKQKQLATPNEHNVTLTVTDKNGNGGKPDFQFDGDEQELILTIEGVEYNLTGKRMIFPGTGDIANSAGNLEHGSVFGIVDKSLAQALKKLYPGIYLLNRFGIFIPNNQDAEFKAQGAPGSGHVENFEGPRCPFVCFTAGTLIKTQNGERSIENIDVGDFILTVDHGPQAVRWIGSRKLCSAELEASPNLYPIRIRAGTLGKNTPESDLMVSPQHRILVRSQIAQRMFDTGEVLVGAKHLLEIDGIEIAEDITEVEYFHILFDRHEVIFSNGAETESLHTGPEAVKSLSPSARKEIFTLFPELQKQEPALLRPAARPLVSGRMGRQLAMRHLKNNRELFY